jgi:hypothetical protein
MPTDDSTAVFFVGGPDETPVVRLTRMTRAGLDEEV